MKTILIATDFSAAAHNASRYAIEFAKAFNSKVILFHALKFMYPPAGSVIVSSAAELKENCEEELQKLADNLSSDAGGNVDIEVIVEDTTVIGDAIVSKAIEKQASLIFVGMKGRGKTIRKIFGSTVTTLSRYSGIPLLVIPEEACYTAPTTIAFANDIDAGANLAMLKPVKEIGEKFNSKLLLTRVIRHKGEEVVERLNRSEALKFHLSHLDPDYVYIVNDSVPDGLSQCIKDYKVNMIVMVPHYHNVLERLFERSYTNEMLFHTHVPLLILPEKLHDVKEPTTITHNTLNSENCFAIK